MRNAANSGDVSGISGITNPGIAAGVWRPGETGGSPTTHNVNDLNADEAMASDAGYFREQIDDLPADPLERAIFLEQMAARARTVSGKWDAANVNVGFADDAGNPVDPKEYFLAVARRLDTFAAENREIGRSNRAGADAVVAFMAADATASSPLGIAPQPTDPEEADRRLHRGRRQPGSDHQQLRAVGDRVGRPGGERPGASPLRWAGSEPNGCAFRVFSYGSRPAAARPGWRERRPARC